MTSARGTAATTAPSIRVPWATMVGLTLLSGLVWSARMAWTEPRFHWLWWNLLLAWVPWLLSVVVVRFARASWVLLIPLLVLWILFLPNAPYLLTDLMHLKARAPVPLAFDAILFSSFALAGCALGWSSLWLIREWVAARLGVRAASVMTTVFVVATGFAVYLGRFLRWNSWDAWERPEALWAAIVESLKNPRALIFSIAFAAFVGAGYRVWNWRARSLA